MSGILIAGVGNIFLGDDAFGVEVLRHLMTRTLPESVSVKDFGIRGFDLAYALLEPWDAVILVDAVPRGDAPGTLYTIEPDLAGVAAQSEEAPDAHSMDPVKVMRMAQSLGEITARVLLVGCEPADLGGEEGRMGLTEPIQRAIPEAVVMVEELVQQIAAQQRTHLQTRLEITT